VKRGGQGKYGEVSSGLLERASDAVDRSRTAAVIARGGLLSRAGFYLLLAYLAVRVVVSARGPQVNASGALKTVAGAPLGRSVVVAAAVGFVAFGVSRILGALRDDEATRTSRLSTGLQGAFYLGLAWVPLSFALGSSKTGSEQQERSTTAKVLMLPGGRVLILLTGVIVVVTCLWQVVTAFQAGFTDSMRTDEAPEWVRRLVRITGKIGIPLRALVFLPLGVFLVVSGAQSDPQQARGLDASLTWLAGQLWGRLLLCLVAAGFVVFAGYSLLEMRYRDVDAGD
jgi:hypothetical protein